MFYRSGTFCRTLFALGLSLGTLTAQANIFDDLSGYAQFRYGQNDVKDGVEFLNSDMRYQSADLEQLKEIGFALQIIRPGAHRPLTDHSFFEYGYDFDISYRFDHHPSVAVYVGDQGSSIDVTNRGRFSAGDLSAGIFLAARPTQWLRIYSAGGPSLVWGRVRHETRWVDQARASDRHVIIDTRTNDTQFELRSYFRAGVDFILPNGVIVGAGMRRQNFAMDIGSESPAYARVKLTKPAYFISLGSTY